MISNFNALPNALTIKTQKKTRKYSGTWRMNGRNQIQFAIGKAGGKEAALTFPGSWRITEDSRIFYSEGKKRILFKGRWGLSELGELTYFLGGNSLFRIRGAFPATIDASKGVIRYFTSTDENGRYKIRYVKLFGTWKAAHKDLIHFEVKGAEERPIAFIPHYRSAKHGYVRAGLATDFGYLGTELLIKKDSLGKNIPQLLPHKRSKEERGARIVSKAVRLTLILREHTEPPAT